MKRSSQAGFTMIEVMVSIVLAAIATSGLVALYMVETKQSGLSRHQTEATILAQDQMEWLRTTKITGGLSTASLDEKGIVTANGIYTRGYTVTATPSGYDDMVVTVSWSEDGDAKTVTLRSRRNQ